MTCERQTYNGWSNRATWNVALWLDNEEALYLAVRRLKQVWYDGGRDAMEDAECLRAFTTALRRYC
jgi:hypothetical protein